MPQVTTNDFILLSGQGVSTTTPVGTQFSFSDDPATTDLTSVVDNVVFDTPEGTFGDTIPIGSTTTINGVEYSLTEAYDFWGTFTKIDPATGEEFTQSGQTIGLTLTAEDGSTLSVIVPSDDFNPDAPWAPGAITSIQVESVPSVEEFGIPVNSDGNSKLGGDDDVTIPCFTTGTLIDTADGRKPVEALVPGDMVLTRDNGFMALRWIGQRAVSADDLAAHPDFAAVIVRAGALGDNLPERDMRVSPWHRLLLTGQRAELMFGEREVLVAALHLVGHDGFERDSQPVTYVHVMFDHHQIIRADGAWSESFQPADWALDGLQSAQRDEVLRLFPELASDEGRKSHTSARMILKPHEAQALLHAA